MMAWITLYCLLFFSWKMPSSYCLVLSTVLVLAAQLTEADISLPIPFIPPVCNLYIYLYIYIYNYIYTYIYIYIYIYISLLTSTTFYNDIDIDNYEIYECHVIKIDAKWRVRIEIYRLNPTNNK